MLSRASIPAAFFLLAVSTAFASTPPEGRKAQSFPAPPVLARAAVVMDGSDGTVLAAVNPHLHLAIASTTKIMTALLALQMGNLSDRIRVPAAAFNYESDATVMGLHPGQVVTLQDLLYGLLLPSGADAANTIAIHYGGSEAHFVTLMNREALALGMHDTHYVTAHGLDAPNQYSSAYDLAILGQYVSYLPDLIRITSTRSYTWNGHTLTNINHVLFWYPGIDGIKPGYTDAAGICQVLDARRNGRHVIVVLLNTPNLVTDARNLLNFGLRDFSWIQSQLPGDGPAVTQRGSDRYGPYVYFPASGHYLRGGFLAGFSKDGGLDALGFPRTEPLQEGHRQVQYFQNGALASAGAGTPQRLALGLTPLPAATATPTPSPTPAPATEATIQPAKDTPTRVPVPAGTPTPRPPSPTPTPSSGSVPAAPVFAAFQRSHKGLLGTGAGAATQSHGYTVQIFQYGALAYDPRSHATWLLPVGDRLLAARRFLPAHPGTAYPRLFAPASVLRTLHWLR